VLRAGSDQQVARLHPQPPRGGEVRGQELPVLRRPGGRAVAAEKGGVERGGRGREHVRQHARRERGGGQVHAEIQPVRRAARGGQDEHAPPVLGAREAAALQRGIGAGDGADAEAELLRQLAMGGQAGAHGELAARHILGQGGGKALMRQARAGREAGGPARQCPAPCVS